MCPTIQVILSIAKGHVLSTGISLSDDTIRLRTTGFNDRRWSSMASLSVFYTLYLLSFALTVTTHGTLVVDRRGRSGVMGVVLIASQVFIVPVVVAVAGYLVIVAVAAACEAAGVVRCVGEDLLYQFIKHCQTCHGAVPGNSGFESHLVPARIFPGRVIPVT